MDGLTIFLRIVHILLGLFWVGAGIFGVVVLTPRLRPLGTPIEAAVMRAVGPVAGPVFTIAGWLVAGSGAALALRIKWDKLDTFFATGWGYAILIAFVLVIVSAVISVAVIKPAADLVVERVDAYKGRDATPEENAAVQASLIPLSRILVADTVLILIAAGAMASARWI